ncbi:MAG TPA: hypothetical protein VJ909_05060 [Prolixibacteraceae bacterium]|nr:hypothetical protein [Prolixibacteraceae bacterium]
MRNLFFYVVVLCFVSSCISFGEDKDDKDKLIFVGSYFTESSEPDYMAKMEVNVQSGEVSVSHLTNMITQRYSYYSVWHNGFSRDGLVAYYADDSNFEDEESSQRWDSFIEPVVLDVVTGDVTRCPVPASPFETNLIPWVRSQKPVYIDNKGRIFYTVWYGLEYGDLHRPTIFRYDPSTGDYTYTKGADAFVGIQPEKGNDTEGGAFGEAFAISDDGRYAYTVIYGYGTSGGAYHTDYSFLVEYDFETDEITRLDGGVSSGSVYAINSDYTKLTYTMGSSKKYINLATRQMGEFGVYMSGIPHCAYAVNSFIDSKTTGLYYVDFIADAQERITERNVFAEQFDRDGNIWFVREGSEENYLCKKADYLADTGCDTIATIPTNLKYVLLVE